MGFDSVYSADQNYQVCPVLVVPAPEQNLLGHLSFCCEGDLGGYAATEADLDSRYDLVGRNVD